MMYLSTPYLLLLEHFQVGFSTPPSVHITRYQFIELLDTPYKTPWYREGIPQQLIQWDYGRSAEMRRSFLMGWEMGDKQAIAWPEDV